MNQETSLTYPRQLACKGGTVEVARMAASDRAALQQFVAALPPDDLLFVPRDISHPKVQDAWMRALDAGTIHSLAALGRCHGGLHDDLYRPHELVAPRG